MKMSIALLALLAATAVHADDAPSARDTVPGAAGDIKEVPLGDAELEKLCAASGGQLKRAAVSSVRRLDCAGAKVAWFRVQTGGNRIVGHYEATREGAWRPALDAALADIAVICGELPPQLQFDRHKLIADCGSDQK
jgi:hypothetical protein